MSFEAIESADISDIESVLARRNLKDFIKLAWPYVEPAKQFQDNWHIDALCDHLTAVTQGHIRRLVINVPPGTMKSLTCSVFWPTWCWTHSPELKFITASYSPKVSKRDAIRSRQLIETLWFITRWGHKFDRNPDAWTNDIFRNSKGGLRLATTVGGAATGEHADIQLVDDPIKPLDAPGDRVDSAALGTAMRWWAETMSTRLADPNTSRRVIIMQRLHEHDLAGFALDSGNYEHLCLPMEAERRCVISVSHSCSMLENNKGQDLPPTSLDFKDPRNKGDLLWPTRYSKETVVQVRKDLGPRAAAAQLDQSPTPSGGGIFKNEYFKYWRIFPKLPGTQYILSMDCAFKDLQDSDWVVIQLWAKYQADFYLCQQARGKLSFGKSVLGLLAMCRAYPRASAKLVEDKANGTAVMNVLQDKVPGLIAVNPLGGKVARAHSVEPYFAAGNVYFPDPKLPGYGWVEEVLLPEIIKFNGDPGRSDDQVDALTQAISYFVGNSTESYTSAMRNIGSVLNVF